MGKYHKNHVVHSFNNMSALHHLCIFSEGTLAYHWSQFDIPEKDREIVPELSEERVVRALLRGIRQEGRQAGSIAVNVSDITASCKMIDNSKESMFAPHSLSAVIRLS